MESFMNTFATDFVSHEISSKSLGTSSQTYPIILDFWLDDFTSWHSVFIHYIFFIKNQILFLTPASFIQKKICNTQVLCIIDNFALAKVLMICEWQRSTNRLSLTFSSMNSSWHPYASHQLYFCIYCYGFCYRAGCSHNTSKLYFGLNQKEILKCSMEEKI